MQNKVNWKHQLRNINQFVQELDTKGASITVHSTKTYSIGLLYKEIIILCAENVIASRLLPHL